MSNRNTVIELLQNVALSPSEFEGLVLPFNLSNGKTVTLRGGGGLRSLDFGNGSSGTPLVLLSLQPGSTLVLDSLNVSGTASPREGKAQLATSIELLPVWPTIDAAPGAAVNISDSSILMYPNIICSPEQVAATVQNLNAVAGRPGLVVADGLTGRFGELALQLPVVDASNAPVGTIAYSLDSTNITCVPASAGAGSPPSPPSPPEPAPVLVGSGPELLVALQQAAAAQGPGSSVVQLAGNITLTPADAANLTLPLTIGPNRTLELRGGTGSTLPSLDFGGITELLFMSGGSRIVVQGLNITGVPHANVLAANLQDPSSAPTVKAPMRAEAFHLYPTINGAPGFEADVRDLNLLLSPSKQCSQEQVANQAAFLQQQTGNLSAAWAEGLTLHVVANTANLPVLNATTGQQAGTMLLRSKGTNSTCTRAAGPSSDAAAAESDSGGTPGWVWAIVGVAAAAGVAAVAGGLLWRRRRSRLAQQAGSDVEAQEGQLSKQHTSDGSCKEVIAGQHASDQTNSGPQGSSDGLLSSGGDGAADNLWKARVGFIEGLALGGVIGGGAQGKVYKGRWRGTLVACKVIPSTVAPGSRVNLSHEPLLSMSLAHPNICQSFKACVVQVLPDAGGPEGCGVVASSSSAGTSPVRDSSAKIVASLTDRNALVKVMDPAAVLEPGMYEAWIVSEYADRGSLADALRGGLLEGQDGRDMGATLLCLLDVARGLEFLHSCNIVHGDVKPQNVLIKTENRDRRGYVCKLADFGLSHLLGEEQTHVQTASWGTVSHAAPELLREGRLTKKADIYSFALLMYPCLTGRPAFEGVQAMRVIHLVTAEQFRLPVPDDVPLPLADLMRQCWAESPTDRPDASQVVQALAKQGAALSRKGAVQQTERSV
ncbi:kinase [Chlorella sorokiniana]|uniref:Kinase n=1 Tax=Chlorella sorokiniana TaxID=3076 RepID=A0A2P6TQU6_CHLSO|nr:kinase [Chlorella sorokiniana]|eukprot:PRW56437.1 kinase [Chlorella sorokiniana]